MADKKLYTKDSIESLSPLEFTRLKPGVYAGDTTYSTQLLVEIVSNAVDEFRLGHGNLIEVNIDEGNNVISVMDHGQGFLPNEMREDGTSVLEAAFSILNTSGKYREDGTYEGTSLGSFGIGSKITTYLSHWLKVLTWRDGKSESVEFQEGVFKERTTPSLPESYGKSGTFVVWSPSEQFFTHTGVENKKVRDLLNTISCLCPGLRIILQDEQGKTEYYSEHGLNDLVDEAVKGKEIITNRFNMQYSEGKEKLDMVLTYTSNYSLTLVPYVNTGLTEKGPHITQVKTIITREFNKFFRDKKWLKDKDENLTGDDIQEGMYIVFNMTAPNVAYDAQVKSTVTKLDMSNFASIIAVNLQYWLASNEKEIKTIFDKAAAARKAREAAKNARERVRETNKKKEKVLKFDSKLADCFSKDRSKCEIYITEGDSASGNLKTARDNEFQAVMPVRGKILNTQKATLDKIQKNAEIMTMIEAFGLTIDVKNMKVTYEPEDLRYGKIIIMSDADVDGAHIKNLFYTFIWNFCPQLIQDGYVYAGVPPLYKVTIGKEYKYIKNDEELEKFKKENPTKKYTVNRMKGLGEMSVEETEQTLTDPNERILKQITVDDVSAANVLFEQLMGTGVTARKEYIRLHSQEAVYNAE